MGMSMRALTNRLNSLQSTGPKSPEGMRKATENAIKHGLLATGGVLKEESVRLHHRLRKRLIADLEPVGEVEILLASRIASLIWRLRRFVEWEVEMTEFLQVDRERTASAVRCAQPFDFSPAEIFATSCEYGDQYSKLRRYEAHLDRLLYRALHELERVQLARQGEAVAAPAVVEVTVHGGHEAA